MLVDISPCFLHTETMASRSAHLFAIRYLPFSRLPITKCLTKSINPNSSKLQGLVLQAKKDGVRGFTLIEAVVVVTILGILALAALAAINPAGDIAKANDAVRRLDLQHIREAIDTYYHDHNCYPQPQDIPFGSRWAENGVVYMQKVPQDPDFVSTGWKYQYQTDTGSSCPQWNVLYAHLLKAPSDIASICPLARVCTGYVDTNYSYCLFSGIINCSYIIAHPLTTP